MGFRYRINIQLILFLICSKYLPKIQTKGKERNINFLKELLIQYIESFHVLGAIETYQLLEKAPTGKEKIEDSLKQELLELLCFNNNEEEIDSERHHLMAVGNFPDTSPGWKADGLAETLYSEIVTSKNSNNHAKHLARLAILCGRGKFKGEAESQIKMQRDSTGKLVGILQLKDECKV